MRLLIENGADVNAVNTKNNSALILTIDKGIHLWAVKSIYYA